MKVFDVVDKVSELKEQKLKKDIIELNKLANNISKALDEYKKDYRAEVEKQLIKKEGDINELEKEKIKEEGIKEFLAKAKTTQSLKTGVKFWSVYLMLYINFKILIKEV